MIVMAIKRCTKRHTKCRIDLENLRTMLTASKYCTKPLSITYSDLDGMPVDLLLMFNPAKASSAGDQSPA